MHLLQTNSRERRGRRFDGGWAPAGYNASSGGKGTGNADIESGGSAAQARDAGRDRDRHRDRDRLGHFRAAEPDRAEPAVGARDPRRCGWSRACSRFSARWPMPNWARCSRPPAASMFTSAKRTARSAHSCAAGRSCWRSLAGGSAWLAVTFSIYAGYFVPLTPLTAKIVSVALIAVLSAVNYVGVQEGAWVQRTFTGLKIAGLLVLIGAGLLSSHTAAPARRPTARRRCISESRWRPA